MQIRISTALVAALLLASCYNRAGEKTAQEKPVARVGKATLSRSDIVANVPPGMSEADSIEYVRRYVNNWVDRELVDQAALPVLDMAEIDRRVEKYRRDLITAEYRRYRFDTSADTAFTDKELKEYYNRHKELFTVGHPMVKGIYLKVPDHAADLREIRRLLQHGGNAAIDRLEGMVAGTAIHYDYFRDTWVEWRSIEQLIPTRFATEPMAVFRGQKMLDLSIGGFTYLLKVDSYLPSGNPLPYEQALPQIHQRLTNRARMNFDATFQQLLRKEAEDKGIVEISL